MNINKETHGKRRSKERETKINKSTKANKGTEKKGMKKQKQ